MTPNDHPNQAKELCDVCWLLGQRGWCRATSGNFSVRIDASNCMITKSGREKSTLTPDDLMICDLKGKPADPADRSSAETPLHTALYQLDSRIGAVLHTHSVAATVLSRVSESRIDIRGFEMQKALTGVCSHEETVSVVVFENDQDMDRLAKKVRTAWHENRFPAHCFLIEGHGLYVWGTSIREAQRHLEGLEFLFECVLQESQVNPQ